MPDKDDSYFFKIFILFFIFNIIVKKNFTNMSKENSQIQAKDSNAGSQIIKSGDNQHTYNNIKHNDKKSYLRTDIQRQLNIEGLVLDRGINILKNIIPFFDKEDQASIAIFIKLVNIVNDIRTILNPRLINLKKDDISIKSFDGDEYDKLIEMLKSIKPFIREQYHKQVDMAEKFNCVRKNYRKYIEEKHKLHSLSSTNMPSLDLGMLKVMSPILTKEQNKKIENFVRAAKIFELLNKMESKNNNEKQILDIVKTVLNKEQQQNMKKLLTIFNSINTSDNASQIYKRQNIFEKNNKTNNDKIDKNKE